MILKPVPPFYLTDCILYYDGCWGSSMFVYRGSEGVSQGLHEALFSAGSVTSSTCFLLSIASFWWSHWWSTDLRDTSIPVCRLVELLTVTRTVTKIIWITASLIQITVKVSPRSCGSERSLFLNHRSQKGFRWFRFLAL